MNISHQTIERSQSDFDIEGKIIFPDLDTSSSIGDLDEIVLIEFLLIRDSNHKMASESESFQFQNQKIRSSDKTGIQTLILVVVMNELEPLSLVRLQTNLRINPIPSSCKFGQCF